MEEKKDLKKQIRRCKLDILHSKQKMDYYTLELKQCEEELKEL